MTTERFVHPAFEIQREVFEQTHEFLQKGQKLPDALETMNSVDVGETPSEVVHRENKLKLLHYESQTDTQHSVPILIVYALINRPYILDLQEDRSVVRTLLENGFDVYLIDWGEPSNLDKSLTLWDYVGRYIDNCVDVVCRRSQQDSISILGYCMGGTMSAMYASLFSENVRNLLLMASGLSFCGESGILELWGDEDYYDPNTVAETFGNVPAEFLAVGFDLMNPIENLVSKYVNLFEGIEDDDFVKNFARMNQWIYDGIDVAGSTYQQFIEDIYQDNKLMENELELNGHHVDLNNITMPVLQIIGEYDHLIPPEACKPFNDRIASQDCEIYEFPTGHVGLSVSSHSHESLWPKVCDWLAKRSRPDEDSNQASTDPSPVQDSATTNNSESDEARQDLESIDGVGPVYAGRLQEAGIEDTGDLANLSYHEIIDITGVSESRAQDWHDQAHQR